MNPARDDAPEREDDDRADDERALDQELESARELLDRTVRFLTRCIQDPRGAMESDDPRALIQELKNLGVEPSQDSESTKAPRSIDFRRRRSA